jgi:glycosyltransferase involved in cell wall biosynthesis
MNARAVRSGHAFNYVITVHNKEEVLDRVLAGVASCAGPQARIVCVLDGCTDGSEAIARRFAQQSGLEVQVVTAPDVHEIRSINIGLRACKPGYCIVLQDDVVLCEPELEQTVHALCEAHHRQLGYLSFRLAADVRCAHLGARLRLAARFGMTAMAPLVEDVNHIAGRNEELEVPKVALHEFHPRMVGIKSPVCVTPELRSREPFLDEIFAPYCYDDVDLSLRSLRHGLTNGLFSVRFESKAEWSGTRKDPHFASSRGAMIRLRNRRLIWRKHGTFIKGYSADQEMSRLAG